MLHYTNYSSYTLKNILFVCSVCCACVGETTNNIVRRKQKSVVVAKSKVPTNVSLVCDPFHDTIGYKETTATRKQFHIVLHEREYDVITL